MLYRTAGEEHYALLGEVAGLSIEKGKVQNEKLKNVKSEGERTKSGECGALNLELGTSAGKPRRWRDRHRASSALDIPVPRR